MLNDKRKAARRPLRYTAWISTGPNVTHGCALSDISDTGARLDVENSKTIPKRFVLMLSSKGNAKRKCTVVWRTDSQIGVAFDKRPAPGDKKFGKRLSAIAAPSLAPNVPPPRESASTAKKEKA